jgi:hypothetical protein
MSCDDCEEKVAVLKCLECELNLCQPCSDDIHRKGSMRTHQSEGKFTIFSANSSDGPTVQKSSGASNTNKQNGPSNGGQKQPDAAGSNFSLAAPDSISLSFLEQASKPFTPMLGSGSMEPKATLWGAQGHAGNPVSQAEEKRENPSLS